MPGIVKNMVKRFQTGRDWHIFRKIKKKIYIVVEIRLEE